MSREPAQRIADALEAIERWQRMRSNAICITDEHRLVYLVDEVDLVILQARYHY